VLTSICLCAVSLRHYIKDFQEETLKKNKALAEEIARSCFNLFIMKKKTLPAFTNLVLRS
jgi:hypothetical protein